MYDNIYRKISKILPVRRTKEPVRYLMSLNFKFYLSY